MEEDTFPFTFKIIFKHRSPLGKLFSLLLENLGSMSKGTACNDNFVLQFKHAKEFHPDNA